MHAAMKQHANAAPMPAPRKPSPSHIKCITYNLLANKFAGYHASFAAPEDLAWPTRLARIQAELDRCAGDTGLDIVCLQEVEETSFKAELQPFFHARGLVGWFHARNLPPDAVSEGIALFVRSARLKPLDVETFCFSECLGSLPQCPSDGAGASMAMERKEGAIMALLEHVESGKKLVAACTHLFWNPAYADVKVLQAAILCQQLASFSTMLGAEASGTHSLPVVLGGDFNSLACKKVPDQFDPVIDAPLASGVYELLAQGSVAPTHPDHPHTRRPGSCAGPAEPLTSAGLQLQSVHMAFNGREPAFTTKTATFAGTLDYLWVSRSLAVVDVLPLPYEDGGAWKDPLAEFPSFMAAPNAQHPSDHLPICCTVSLV